jgi:hypothetical protein
MKKDKLSKPGMQIQIFEKIRLTEEIFLKESLQQE